MVSGTLMFFENKKFPVLS